MHLVVTRIAIAVGLGLTLSGPSALAATPDWRRVPHPAAEATLTDVAALSGTDAWSVGSLQPPNASSRPLAEHWDGTSWTAVPVPATPTGGGELDGVSAVSANDVWAVGDSSGLGPVIRHWDGTSWTVVPPASPPGTQHPGTDRLNDLAALPTGQAWAVGRFSGAFGATLIEGWDGTKWSRMTTPSPGVYDNMLNGVAAVSATDAWAVGWAVGDQGNVALALHWNGKAWTRSTMKPPPGNTELQGVTTVSASDVWAVGTNEGRPLVMHWDGTRWRTLSPPVMPSSRLQTVSADGRGGVWAAGYQMTDDGTVSRPLFLHWDGSRWATGTSEEPEGVVYGLGRSGSSVWAVGTTSPCSCFVAPPLVETSG